VRSSNDGGGFRYVGCVGVVEREKRRRRMMWAQ